jgi:hypothetical protein
VDFLGTTDTTALELKVNGQRALRLMPNTNGAPNVIGGSIDNFASVATIGVMIGGGSGNGISDESTYSTIGGGIGNRVSGQRATIGGGASNTIGSSFPHFEAFEACTISGGFSNYIGRGNTGCTISGGIKNWISGASSDPPPLFSTIGGGEGNRINEYSSYSTVGGGQANIADGNWTTISGGKGNFLGFSDYSTIGGGSFNTNKGRYSTIGGGSLNVNSGQYGTIPGGKQNVATNYSFAAGSRAKALHSGSYVWSDDNDFDFPSTTANEFSARSTGGARFVSAIDTGGIPIAGVELPSGGGAWSSLCDRNAKENLAAINPREVLDKVSRLSIATWNYKSQDAAIRHIGPMAQDFAAAFQVGENERRITTVDADGVALAAIQGLNQKLEATVKEKDAKIQALESRLAKVEQFLQTLAQRENGGGQ